MAGSCCLDNVKTISNFGEKVRKCSCPLYLFPISKRHCPDVSFSLLPSALQRSSILVIWNAQDPPPSLLVFQVKLATRLVEHGAVVPAILFRNAFRTSPGATSAASLLDIPLAPMRSNSLIPAMNAIIPSMNPFILSYLARMKLARNVHCHLPKRLNHP